MRTLSIREARAALSHIEEIVDREGEVLITRHGRPVARLVPVQRTRPVPSHRALRQRMAPLPTGSEVLVRRERDER